MTEFVNSSAETLEDGISKMFSAMIKDYGAFMPTDTLRKINMNEDIIIDNFENALPFYYGLSDLYTALIKIESQNEHQKKDQEISITSMRGKTGLVWSIMQDNLPQKNYK